MNTKEYAELKALRKVMREFEDTAAVLRLHLKMVESNIHLMQIVLAAKEKESGVKKER